MFWCCTTRGQFCSIMCLFWLNFDAGSWCSCQKARTRILLVNSGAMPVVIAVCAYLKIMVSDDVILWKIEIQHARFSSHFYGFMWLSSLEHCQHHTSRYQLGSAWVQECSHVLSHEWNYISNSNSRNRGGRGEAGQCPECCPGDRRGDRTTSGHVVITIGRILTGQAGQG